MIFIKESFDFIFNSDSYNNTLIYVELLYNNIYQYIYLYINFVIIFLIIFYALLCVLKTYKIKKEIYKLYDVIENDFQNFKKIHSVYEDKLVEINIEFSQKIKILEKRIKMLEYIVNDNSSDSEFESNDDYNSSESESDDDDDECKLIYIDDHSDKSFGVFGDTKKYKNELKKLGGIFNYNLKGKGGWIFSNKNKKNVVEFLEKL